jgi:hypothetical protein
METDGEQELREKVRKNPALLGNGKFTQGMENCATRKAGVSRIRERP